MHGNAAKADRSFPDRGKFEPGALFRANSRPSFLFFLMPGWPGKSLLTPLEISGLIGFVPAVRPPNGYIHAGVQSAWVACRSFGGFASLALRA